GGREGGDRRPQATGLGAAGGSPPAPTDIPHVIVGRVVLAAFAQPGIRLPQDGVGGNLVDPVHVSSPRWRSPRLTKTIISRYGWWEKPSERTNPLLRSRQPANSASAARFIRSFPDTREAGIFSGVLFCNSREGKWMSCN